MLRFEISMRTGERMASREIRAGNRGPPNGSHPTVFEKSKKEFIEVLAR